MTTATDRPARVGVVTDQTGALSFMGIANANVATMVIDDINAQGGLLGRPIELFIEDSATEDSAAEAAATKLVEDAARRRRSRRHLQLHPPGHQRAAVDQGRTLYIYPEQYEGQECDPLIFCTGPVPAQQVEPLIPWLMRHTGARTFYLPSADYIWPHIMNKKVHKVVASEGGSIVGEEYFPMDHTDYDRTVDDIMASGADVVFNTIVPPGLTPFLDRLYEAGFTKNGGHIVCTYFDENFLNLVPAEHVDGLYGCLDYYRDVNDPFSTALLDRYEERFPGSATFTAGSACTGHVPRSEALGGGRGRSRLTGPGRSRRGTGPRSDRRGPRRSRGDGARSAPPPIDHVHRAVRRGHVQGDQEPRGHRPAGVRGRGVTAVPGSDLPRPEPGPAEPRRGHRVAAPPADPNALSTRFMELSRPQRWDSSSNRSGSAGSLGIRSSYSGTGTSCATATTFGATDR